jgi:hypothetical protein
MPTEISALRKQLVALLKGGQAHADMHSAVADFPLELTGKKPHGLPYSAWQLLEHMRFTLHDLLDFSTNPEYKEHKWPDDYWPKSDGPPSKEHWQKSVKELKGELDAFISLVEDEDSNLFDTIPWGKHRETLLREVLLAADHNAYHTGELIVVRRLLGAWK